MRFSTLYHIVLPLGANSLLAFGAFVFFSDVFSGRVILCYLTALVATATALWSLVGFIVFDLGPVRTTGTLALQALALVIVFAGIYRGFGLHGHNTVEASTALYFSMVTWTTLGYGDFQPARELQLLAAGQATLGYVFLGLFVGMILASFNIRSAQAD